MTTTTRPSPAASAPRGLRRIAGMLFTAAAVVSLLLCLATAVVWVRSHWATHAVNASYGRWRVEIREDVGAPVLWMFHDDTPVDAPWMYAAFPIAGPSPSLFPASAFMGFGAVWEPADRINTPPGFGLADLLILTMPYWSVFVVLAILPAVWLPLAARRLRRARRRRLGLCVACGYDLRASAAVCPECGHPAPSPSVQPAN